MIGEKILIMKSVREEEDQYELYGRLFPSLNCSLQEDDEMWPQPDRVGRQELEILLNDEHISFTTRSPLYPFLSPCLISA